MFKRRATIDPFQKKKKNKQVQMFNILELCLQISADDKLILRNKIKQQDKQIINYVLKCKKDKNFHQLQIHLRKCLQTIKGNSKFNILQQLRGLSSGKRCQTPSSTKNKNNITQNSHPTSLQNSLYSSPSAQEPSSKTKMVLTKLDLQKHIQYQIDKQIEKNIQNQQITMPCRGITPRQQKPTISKNIMTDVGNQSYQLKELIKNKINSSKTRKSQNYQCWKVSKKLKINKNSEIINCNENHLETKRINRGIDCVPTLRNPKYGQFYKRIRMVIQQNHA